MVSELTCNVLAELGLVTVTPVTEPTKLVKSLVAKAPLFLFVSISLAIELAVSPAGTPRDISTIILPLLIAVTLQVLIFPKDNIALQIVVVRFFVSALFRSA